MQRIYLTVTLILLFLGGEFWQVAAQSETDAYRLTQRELNGSARYTAMAGAFTALGGDLSAIEKNPAAIGVFHRSQMSFTGQINTQNSNSSWFNTFNQDQNTRVHFGQVGFVGSFFNARSGNGVSMSINRSQPYIVDRQIDARNAVPQMVSLADYVAFITPEDLSSKDLSEEQGYDPYREAIPWFSTLGFNSGWIIPTKGIRGPFDTSFYYPRREGSSEYIRYGPSSSGLLYREFAKISEIDFAFSYNYQDRLYAGFSMKVTNLEYSLSTNYDESFIDGDYLTLDNELKTKGRGFGGSLGAIVRPTDYLRLGIAFHLPSILYLTDFFDASGSSRYSYGVDEDGNPLAEDMWVMRSRTPEASIADYQLLSPSRFTFGMACTFGRRGLLSVDYEMIPLGGMKIKDAKGNSGSYQYDNTSLRRHYALQQSMSIGGELFVIPQLALRAGYMYKSPAMKSAATATINNDTHHAGGTGVMREQILVAGTLPHFIIQGNTHTATCGIGYRISERASLDASFLFNTRYDKLYTFPTLLDNKDNPIGSLPIEVKQKNYRFYLTFAVTY